MKNKTLLLLALIALPFTVQAGGSELHGGDSVVCFQTATQKQEVEKILRQNKVASQMGHVRQDPFDGVDLNSVTVETLDIWETKHSSVTHIKFIDVDNVEKSVKERIDILNTKFSYMAQQMESALEGFYAPSKWLASSTGVVEIDDSRELINFTKLCIPVQIAVQTKTRVYYDARLYSRMNDTNKVALILHELLYSWLKKYSENSLNVRKYVGLMMTEDFDSYSTDGFLQEFLADYYGHFYSIPRGKISCPAKAIVEGIEVNFSLEVHGINSRSCKNSRENFLSASYTNKNELNKVSAVLGVQVSQLLLNSNWYSEEPIKVLKVELVDGQTYHVTNAATDFKIVTNDTWLDVENGIINRFPESTKKLEILGQEIVLNEPTMLYYNKSPSGQTYLRSFDIDSDYVLKSAGLRKTKKCASGSRVLLNPEGLVESCR